MILFSMTFFLAATQLFAPGTYTSRHYRDLTVLTEKDFRGAPSVCVTGPEKPSDTAWRMTSGRVCLADGARSFRLSFKAYADRRIYGTDKDEEGWCNAILWYKANGNLLRGTSLGFSIPRGDFSEIEVSGPIPAGAVEAAIQIGFDLPNLIATDTVAYRDFVFETGTAEKKDGVSIVERPKPLPPRPVEKRTFRTDRMPDTPAVTLRDDGMTLVGGKPFFPVGIYGVCKREYNAFDLDIAFRELKDAGFNFAHTYGNAWEPAFLGAARKYGFKLWVEARWPDKRIVDEGRFNPDILAWYTGDDTSGHQTPEESRAYHDALKSVDPTRLTCQADGVDARPTASHYTDFVNSTDVFMPELYGIRGKEGDVSDVQCVAWVIREMEGVRRDIANQAKGRVKGVWPILQSFNGWSSWQHYPTRAQLFATSFATLIHGANGIVWYTYGGFYDRKRQRRNEGITSSPERFRDIAELATWIKELSPVLLERTGRQPPPARVLSGPACDPLGNPSISRLLKRHGDEAYLLTVNSSFEKVKARFQVGDVPPFADVMREQRKFTVVDGAFEDEFEPFAVHVYRFSPVLLDRDGKGGFRPVETYPHELDVLVRAGHIQGACCSEEGVYLSHMRGCEMIGWDGRLVRRMDAPPHFGDSAFRDGKLYGAFAFLDRKGQPGSGAVRVWDGKLNLLKERKFDVFLDGITVLDGYVYVGVDCYGYAPHPEFRVKKLDLDLNEVADVTIPLDFKVNYGVQTMATDGRNILCGMYGAPPAHGNPERKNFVVLTPDLEFVRSESFGGSEGFDRVPPSVCGGRTNLFFKVEALGGNMQGWRKNPVGNPPRIRLDFRTR